MKNRNKAFIIFSPAFPANEAENWVPFMQTFIMGINRNFPKLNIIVFAFQYPYSTKSYLWRSNKIIPFNGFYKGKAARLLMWMKIFFEVRKISKEYDILGIFSQWCTECTFVAKYISKYFRVQYFCWIHGGDAKATNTYVKRITPDASSLIAVSDFLVDEFYANHYIKPQYIIPTGIDISLFGPPVKKDIDIIGVGSFSKLKQFHLFVGVVAALKKEVPYIKAMLCGNGEEREHIESLIKKLSLNESVTLTGFVAHTESLRMMQRAKILLHPSSYEGFGNVCLEALYAGAHVISFVQPMHYKIHNWHIVKTTEAMQQKALELLQDVNTSYESVLVYESNDAAKKVLALFGYNA